MLRAAGAAVEPGAVQITYDPADESCVIMVLGIDDTMVNKS